MKKWFGLIIVLLAIAMVASAFKENEPRHDPAADITQIAHSYSGGGDLKLENFHATGVMEATIVSYSDGWQRIDFIRANGSGGSAMVYNGT